MLWMAANETKRKIKAQLKQISFWLVCDINHHLEVSHFLATFVHDSYVIYQLLCNMEPIQRTFSGLLAVRLQYPYKT